MRIRSINQLNFNGIKVIKKEEDGPKSTETTRQSIIENWGKDAKVLRSTADSISTSLGLQSADRSRIDRKYDGRDIYEQNMTNIDTIRPNVQRRVALLNKATELAQRSIEALNAIDRDIQAINARRGLEANINAKDDDFGISKVAGYGHEMDVLYGSFIDKIKREQQGEDVEVFNGVLFFGPWGNGKTHITEAVAEETGCKVVSIISGSDKPEKIKATMQEILKEAQKAQERFENKGMRTILLMDEIGRLVDKKSPVAKEFEEFIKTCSKKYHCSIFAATNDPFNLGVDLEDPDIFAIRMSIDPPADENAAAVFEYGLKDYPKGELDYNAIVSALLEQGRLRGGQFNNGQILNICDEVWKEGQGKDIEQRDIIEYMQAMQITPEISGEMGAKFNNDRAILIDTET